MSMTARLMTAHSDKTRSASARKATNDRKAQRLAKRVMVTGGVK